jgi:glycosyltransferase involved in cell wall biosynthesis
MTACAVRPRAQDILQESQGQVDTTRSQANPGTPLVSVVTVCRNAAATLQPCLDSVAAQTWPAVEHIVIDGASSDGTIAILEAWRTRLAVLVSEPDSGLYDAMNKGIARAQGEFVLFLNADDLFAGPDALTKAMAEIAADPSGDVYYGSLEVRAEGRQFTHAPPPPELAAEEMVLGCLPHQATLARRAVFARTGPFDLRWRRHADYAWWIKVISDPEIRLRRIATVVASFAMGGASSDLAKGQPEVFAIQNEASIYRTPEWDRRRIELFQQAWLRERIDAGQLREALGAPACAPSLRGRLAQYLPAGVTARLGALARRFGAS